MNNKLLLPIRCVIISSMILINLACMGIGSSTVAGSASLNTSISCPTGYVPVPHNSNYTSTDFCVGKYIASQSGSQAVSVATNTPWVNITQPSAITACQANGAGYDLISNAEWQTIAQNIEQQASNWSGGALGNGFLSNGMSNGFQSSVQVANVSDSQGCYLTGDSCTTNWDNQKRTFNLSNGNVVWDISGNAYEFMKDLNTTNFGTSNNASQVTATTNPIIGTLTGGAGIATGTAVFLFGPAGNYTSLNTGTIGAVQSYGGLGWMQIGFNGGAMVRGGCISDLGYTGIFALSLDMGTSNTAGYYGFRCVYHVP